jgi:hypothetical protein
LLREGKKVAAVKALKERYAGMITLVQSKRVIELYLETGNKVPNVEMFW